MQRQLFLLALTGCILWWSCAGSRSNDGDTDIEARFNRGLDLFEKGKYLRAQEVFADVLIRGRHTDLGDEAQFYLAESYFRNKEYLIAIDEYDRLVRQMSYSPFVEESRFRICESYARLSPKYYHDQAYTERAIDRFQEFLEDYPNSEHREQSMESIRSLREKMARKLYESAILYIKMEEYSSSILYFEKLLELYYDTEYADLARLKTVETHIRAGSTEKAEAFLNENKSRFSDSKVLEQARQIIDSARSGNQES